MTKLHQSSVSILVIFSDLSAPFNKALLLEQLPLPMYASPSPPYQKTIIKNIPHKAIVFLTYINNSMLETTYFLTLWKTSFTIMTPSKTMLLTLILHTHIPPNHYG